uniref:C-C motif chemokine n=1 Tax=Sciurus vulgaris TaxID=55149 RepID=A0A8D2B7F9_SCIVU
IFDFHYAVILVPHYGTLHSNLHGTPDAKTWPSDDLSLPAVFHHAADCCFSYTPRRIRCTFMKGYFETSSGCSQPGVIFLNKRGQHICANPNDEKVLECMANLSFNSLPMDLGQ